MTDKYLGIFQVRRSRDLGHRNKGTESRVFDLTLKQFAEFTTDKFIHLLDTIRHNISPLGPSLSNFRLEELQYIADLKIVKVLDAHTTLVARGYLFDVILKAPEAADGRLTYHLFPTPQSD